MHSSSSSMLLHLDNTEAATSATSCIIFFSFGLRIYVKIAHDWLVGKKV